MNLSSSTPDGQFQRTMTAPAYDARILKVVHDELVVEVREDQAKTVASLMEQQMILGFSYYFKKIPMKVDVNIADTWEK